MPKIRGVKPDYWTDEDIVELSIPARLLFIGLWNLSCDNGHVPDKPKQIKMRILPADDVDPEALLAEIADRGRITRLDGTITIKNFAKHQKPHKRWWATCDLPLCVLPDGCGPQVYNRGATVEPPEDTDVHGESTPDVDGDVDSEGDKERGPRKLGHRLPENWLPTAETRALIASERPDLDLRVEHQDFLDYWHAEAGQKARKVNWDLAWRRWMRGQGKRNGQQRTPTQAVPAYAPLPLPDESELDWDPAS